MAETLFSPPRMPPTNGRYPAIKTDWTFPDLGEPWPFQITYLPNGWGVSVADIDTDLAEKMLTTNTDNQRNRRPSMVDRYVSDMLAGRWLLTHQGVAFNKEGRLHDGQNRLAASVASGFSFRTLVFFGVGDDQEMARFDSGGVRTAADAARICGVEHVTSNDIALLRAFLKGPESTNKPLTNSFLLEQVIRFRAMILFARTLPVNKFLPSPVRGALGRALYYADAARLARMAGVISTEVPATQPGDKTVMLFRKSMENMFGRGSRHQQRDLYLRAQRTIKAYLDGQDISRVYATEGDDYPLPTDAQVEAANAALIAK